MSAFAPNDSPLRPREECQLIVMGASAGALNALGAVLPLLPRSFRFPIAVVVHIPPEKKSVLVELFRQRCELSVLEAEDKMPLQPGTVYFAPPDYHVLIEDEGLLSLSSEEPVQYSRPSIDMLFESAAEALGGSVVGIVLTGASDDGARGLKAITSAGGLGIVQDPGEAEASIMPRAALEMSPHAQVFSLSQIADYLRELSKKS
ncbi:MAG: chemotaxis protein CheB [Bdellovibrionota bacterium]